MKKTIKHILPKWALRAALYIRDRIDGILLPCYHRHIFNSSYLRSLKSANKQQLESKLSFHAHAIEKGLSHDNIRLGFGKSALKSIRDTINIYNDKKLSKDNVYYLNAISVLSEYKKIHAANKFKIPYFDKMFSAIIHEIDDNSCDLGGAIKIKRTNPRKQDFKQLFESRWSVREYSDTPVNIRLIQQAISLSRKSPSVCNRQSSRVYVITDKKKIAEVLKIQGGFTGYDLPPILLAITSDMRTFLASTERNQPYIDGGLFSMSLLLALEYYGIAACPLNAMFSKKRDIKAKKACGISKHEALIMFISVGNFKSVSNVPKSFRISLDEVIKTKDV